MAKPTFFPPTQSQPRVYTLKTGNLRPCPNLFKPNAVLNRAAFYAMRDRLNAAPLAAVDTETTGLYVHIDKVIGICFSIAPWDEGWYLPMFNSPTGSKFWEDDELWEEILTWLREFLATKDTIFHNAMFDIPMLYANFGAVVKRCIACTMLLSHLDNPDSEHGLKPRSVIHINTEADWYEIELSFHNKYVGGSSDNPKYYLINIEDVAGYGSADVVFTGKLYEYFLSHIPKHMMAAYYRITLPLIKALMGMRVFGVPLDREYLKRGETWYTAYENFLVDEIRAAIQDPEFNPSSPDQLRDLLYNKLKLPAGRKTKKGYSTDAKELERLRGAHDVVDKILFLRETSKLRGTYFTGLLADLDDNDYLHGDIKLHGTKTGRASMARLHQIPRGPLVKKAFVADEGHVFIGSDHSQLEARVLAHFSQDANLLAIYRENRDIHCATAKLMFNLPCSEKEVKTLFPEKRQDAKTINFALLYLETIAGLAHQLHCTWQEAKVLYDQFFNAYSGVLPWAEREVRMAAQRGYVEMVSGRRRYLDIPDIAKAPYVQRARQPECFALPRYKKGIAKSLYFDLQLKLTEWSRDRAEDTRFVLQHKFPDLPCTKCPVLHECYYKLEATRLKKEIEHSQRQALNSKIQGSAADLVNEGIVRMQNQIVRAGHDGYPCLYVHDEVVFHVDARNTNVDLFAKDLKREMESVSEHITVPLEFEPKIFTSWDELK